MTFLLAALALCVGYASRRQFYLASIDPLKILAIKESVWVYTVSALLEEDIATEAQATVFACCIIVWWIGWFAAGRAWGRRYIATMKVVWERALASPPSIRWSAYALFTFGAVVTLIVTVQFGGGGDNRLSIGKLLRPVEGFTTILAPYIIFLLLADRRWSRKLALGALCALLVYTGGRSALIVLLFPLSALALIQKITITRRQIIGLTALILGSIILSGFLNYGIASPTEALMLIAERVSLDGDIYLVALPDNLISKITTTSLFPYLIGPFLKLIGEPITVDVNIGSQLLGLLFEIDTPNGPNPHWPIVLLAYGHQSLIDVAALTMAGTFAAIFLKVRLLGPHQARRLPLTIGCSIASFAIQYPQYFFTDPSYPLIYLIHAIFIAILWSFVAFFVGYARVTNHYNHHRLTP